jgi:hypothetical protein
VGHLRHGRRRHDRPARRPRGGPVRGAAPLRVLCRRARDAPANQETRRCGGTRANRSSRSVRIVASR